MVMRPVADQLGGGGVEVGRDLGLMGLDELDTHILLRSFTSLLVETFLGYFCVMMNPEAAAPGMAVASISSAGGGWLAACGSLEPTSSTGIELGCAAVG
jgi:hypothetical protein